MAAMKQAAIDARNNVLIGVLLRLFISASELPDGTRQCGDSVAGVVALT